MKNLFQNSSPLCSFSSDVNLSSASKLLCKPAVCRGYLQVFALATSDTNVHRRRRRIYLMMSFVRLYIRSIVRSFARLFIRSFILLSKCKSKKQFVLFKERTDRIQQASSRQVSGVSLYLTYFLLYPICVATIHIYSFRYALKLLVLCNTAFHQLFAIITYICLYVCMYLLLDFLGFP